MLHVLDPETAAKSSDTNTTAPLAKSVAYYA
jgi:hypothetical protein